MSSIAFHGGPMNTMPASVHFRANAEFSLNYQVKELLALPSLQSPSSRARAWTSKSGQHRSSDKGNPQSHSQGEYPDTLLSSQSQ
jgi:hypothetical protein